MSHRGHSYGRMYRDATSSLLSLPHPCLLAVLQCCADDPRSLFNAARAHSKLQQAAVQAASSITAVFRRQDHADAVLSYLNKHGQHVHSISFTGFLLERQACHINVRQLPQSLQGKLESLKLHNLVLQLQPGEGFEGVLKAGVPLTQLQLVRCELLDGEKGLPAALLLLPGLQHLTFSSYYTTKVVPVEVLPELLHLTYLELAGGVAEDDGLRYLQGLTNLQVLSLRLNARLSAPIVATADMLSGLQHLTRLELCAQRDLTLEPEVLAGKSKLQHLGLVRCSTLNAGTASLLSHLQKLEQLTYLNLTGSLKSQGADPAPATYSALTASSKLQHLDLTMCTLPNGVWQHVFPATRQLPQLQELNLCLVKHPSGPAVAPECASLVSCCPGLRSLNMLSLQYSDQLLGPLEGLSGLQDLSLRPANTSLGGLGVVSQLAGLSWLRLDFGYRDDVIGSYIVLGLSCLRQLTYLSCSGAVQFQSGGYENRHQPVWRQLLLHLGRSGDREMSRQANAALIEAQRQQQSKSSRKHKKKAAGQQRR